jgi:hypothetical protein
MKRSQTGVRIGRAYRRPDDLDSGARGDAGEVRSELRVTVADQESRPYCVRCRVAELLRRPRVGRVPRRGDVHHSARRQFDDHEREERAEQGIVGLDEVARPDLPSVLAEERAPRWSRPGSRSPAPHVLLDLSLAAVGAELEEFASDPLGLWWQRIHPRRFPVLQQHRDPRS